MWLRETRNYLGGVLLAPLPEQSYERRAEHSSEQSEKRQSRAKKNKSAISKFVNIECSSALVFWISFWIDQSRALCF